MDRVNLFIKPIDCEPPPLSYEEARIEMKKCLPCQKTVIVDNEEYYYLSDILMIFDLHEDEALLLLSKGTNLSSFIVHIVL